MIDQASTEHPCLFLFDGGARGVIEPALSMFTGALLGAISSADSEGSVAAELRGGLPLLSEFAEQIDQVSASLHGSQHRKTHDMALYRLLLWDMAEALSESEGAPPSRAILDIFRFRREECLAVSAMSDTVRMACDTLLRNAPGYVGCCWLDLGNHIQRKAFFDGLMHLAFIEGGRVLQERSIEGDEEWELEGARSFKPNGLEWVAYGHQWEAGQYRLVTSPLSARGALSLDRLRRKSRTTVEGRVFQALVRASWTDAAGQSYDFAAAETEQDVLQAVLPQGKFTNYLFSREHNQGRAKAGFLIDELGFEPDDWRYLAAQLYDGLLLSEPRDLEIHRWKDGYGARFNVLVEVASRSGRRGVLRTGWLLEPGKLPRLLTALPDYADEGLVRPPVPNVLPPQEPDGAWWEKLFQLADQEGRRAHAATVPTPMLLEGYEIVEEGEVGSATICIDDARKGFARWLLQTGHGHSGYKGGAVVYCGLASQSFERAEAYAKAFSRVLAFNGVASRVETFYT